MSLADARTLDALDFARVRERVVSATRTQRGRALASDLLPESDFAIVRREQLRTEAMRSLAASTDVTIMPAIDTAPFSEAAQIGATLGAPELRSIGDALASAAAAHKAVREHPDLTSVVAPYTPLRELQLSLVDAIDERGTVLDRASPALGRIRRSLVAAQGEARDRISSILNGAKYAKAIQDRVVTIRDGRFVIPIKAEFAGMMPSIVHDTSSSGQTLFVEPLAALESNNRVRTLQIEEEREVQRVLQALSGRVGAHAAEIEANVEVLATLDLLAAKAELARRGGGMMPALSDDPSLIVDNGRHPLLDARAVPQSLRLDDATRLLVISGPNMGGKTVALKMAGLFIVMTYCGMQVPAGGATCIGRFERVVADIGDEQSLAANASTFSAHLQRMREILDDAGARTLAIVDEIGGGTEPSAGTALAVAMLERLLACGTRAIVSTHSTELKLFAHSTPAVANASVRFDPRTFQPTFELDIGAPGQSLAFPLATRLGVSDAIVARATELMEDRERDYEAALAELSLRNSELRDSRLRLESERRDVAAQGELLQHDREALDAQRRRFSTNAEERLAQGLRDFTRELQRRVDETSEQSVRRRARVTPAQTALLAQTIEAIRQDLGIRPEAQKAQDDQAFSAGDRVRIHSLDQEGIVSEDWDERLLVSIGSMKMTVEKSDVTRLTAPEKRARTAAVVADTRMAAAGRSAASLDVRGKRYTEAEPLVERWLDDALLAGSLQLRLIHGKGTGMLGRGLQEFLRGHPAVTGFRYGTEEEGSSGVTIVDLRA
jgi:DNA mismatch repair protein MutS2